MAEIIIYITAIIKGDKIEKVTAFNKEQNLQASGKYFVTKGKDSNTLIFKDIIIDSNGNKKPKYVKDYKILSYYHSHNNSCVNVPLANILDEPTIKISGEKGESKGESKSLEKAIEIVVGFAKLHDLLDAKLSDIVKAIESLKKQAEKRQEQKLEQQIKEMQEQLEKLREKNKESKGEKKEVEKK